MKIHKGWFVTDVRTPLLPHCLAEKRWAVNSIRIISILAAVLCPLYCFLLTEYLHFDSEKKTLAFLAKGGIPLFGLIIFVFIYLLLVLLMKKLWCASLTMTVMSAVIGLVNRLKFSATGDYFYPWDIQQAGNIDELSQFVSADLTVAAYLVIIFSFFFAAVGFVARTELPLTAPVRFAAAIVLVFCALNAVSTPKKAENVINSFGIYFEDTALQSSNYEANGFTAAFAINVLSANVSEPQGYSREAVEDILDGHSDEPLPEDFCYPDVVLILSESFWDVRKIKGSSYSIDPLENFDEITEREGAFSGRMFQTGFGGGTVRPEFEVLTGLTTDGLPAGSVPWRYIEMPTESYVSVLRDIGYETYAVHPYLSRFYDRKRAYGLIGIDNLYFEEDLVELDGVECTYESRYSYVSDESFEKYLEYFLENDRSEKPRFIFGISMENHQSYYNKYENCPMKAECEGLGEDTLNMLSNFAYGVSHADAALKTLVDHIDGRDRPTVLVWFGDHLPSLGANYAAYTESGTVSDMQNRTPEEYELMQSTPFLVYANYSLQGSSELLQKGKDNDITSYNIMNAVFDLIGAPKTELCGFLTEYASVIPYYNSRLGITLNEKEREYVLAHRMLTYDRISAGKRYSLR